MTLIPRRFGRPACSCRPVLAAALLATCLIAGAGSADAVSAPAKKPVVEVFGDRLGTFLAQGLSETNASVAVVTATADDAVISGPSYGEWLRSLHDILARPAKPDVAVMMVGERDHGALVDGAARLEPGTPAWTAAYGARIDAVAKLFADAHVPLVWIGLPPVRSQDGSADASRIDGLLRDRAAADGVRFVDIWSGFIDDRGRYSPDGPDSEGNAARLRRGDGFTPAGMRKLASYASPGIGRLLAQKGASGADLASLTIDRARDFDAALAVDVNAQIRREAARSADAPAPSPGAAALPQGPAAGPILPLTASDARPGAELAALPPAGTSSPPANQAADATPATPAAGRADDFSWPKAAASP